MLRESQSVAVLMEACGLRWLGLPRERGIKVMISMDPDLPGALVDRVQVQRLNLIRNAMEAMDGCAARELTDSRIATDGARCVSIADTAVGVPSRIEDQGLFQPFITTKPEGVGIGLSVCRTHGQAHNGRLWMERRPRGRQRLPFHLADELIQIKAGDRTPL